jgi:hypothetical protein
MIPAPPTNLVAAITLADIGFIDGFRFANLGAAAKYSCHCRKAKK